MLVLAIVIVIGVLYKTGTFTKEAIGKKSNSDNAKKEIVIDKNSSDENSIGDGETEEGVSEEDALVEKYLSDMTLEQKVAQLFFITPEKLTGYGTVTSAGTSTESSISKYPVGGLIYSGKNFENEKQIQEMLENTNKYMVDAVNIPAFLAVAELGGDNASQLAIALGKEAMDSPLTIGGSELPSTAGTSAKKIGDYTRNAGFNMVFAPIADIALADLSFGLNTDVTAAMVAESISGFNEKDLYTVTASFPASGMDNLVPYKAAVNANTEIMIMTNDKVEGLSSDEPCSLSKKAVSYLRDDMEYDGIIMTGNLSERAITGNYDSSEAAVKAIEAGVTMLYMPNTFSEAYDAVLNAVNNGDISEDTIDENVGRIIKAKASMLKSE